MAGSIGLQREIPGQKKCPDGRGEKVVLAINITIGIDTAFVICYNGSRKVENINRKKVQPII